MKNIIFNVFFLLHVISVVEITLCQLIDIDATLNPVELNEDQLFFSRKERFIKFNHKNNELMVEVGISVPFVNVPLTTGRDLFHQNQNPQIKINVPGLIVAGLLMFTSFVVVPTLFSNNNPTSGFGFQRKGDDGRNDDDRFTFVNNIEKALVKSGIDFPSCFRKSICWILKSSKNKKPEGEEEDDDDDVAERWIDYALKSWWFERLTRGTFVEDIINDSSNACDLKCSLHPKNLFAFTEMIKMGKNYFF